MNIFKWLSGLVVNRRSDAIKKDMAALESAKRREKLHRELKEEIKGIRSSYYASRGPCAGSVFDVRFTKID